MTKTATIAEFRSHLAEHLAAVQRGDEVVVLKETVPVAKLVPVARAQTRAKFGSGTGTGKILGPVDEPLIPEGDWDMLTGKSFP